MSSRCLLYIYGWFVVCTILPSDFSQCTDFFFLSAARFSNFKFHLQKLAKILEGIPFSLHAVLLT